MVESIIEALRSCGYLRVQLNTQQVQLFAREQGETMQCVAVFPRDTTLSEAGIFHIIEQIQDGFVKGRGKSGEVLPVFLAEDAQELKGRIPMAYSKGWIIEERTGRLLVYDMPGAGYQPLRSRLDGDLGGTGSTAGYRFASAPAPRKKIRFFSPVNNCIVLINVLVFLFISWQTMMHYGQDLYTNLGALYWPDILEKGEYYRFFTYMFLHFGFSHIFNNMLVLLFIGDNLERAAGKLKYLVIYLCSGVCAGIASVLWNMSRGQLVTSVGASGAIFGVVGAMVYILIVNKGRLEDLRISQIILFACLSLYSGIVSQGVDNAAHLGGFISGAILAMILYRRPKPVSNNWSDSDPRYNQGI